MGGSLTAMKQYILVAGVDYDFKGVNFRIFCNSRATRIINGNLAKDDLRFITIDFPTGEVVTRNVTYPGGRKTESVSRDARHKAITKANYNKRGSGASAHYAFKDGQTDVMSILDVYAEVMKIGKSDPGTLHELSFFSHAYIGGPILVNSYDDGKITVNNPLTGSPVEIPIPSSLRDLDDKTPRPEKDFVPPVMSAAELKLFREAFHKNGLVWIWGCAFPRVVHEILHRVEHHKDYRSSGVTDSQTFTFTNLRADHVAALSSILFWASFADPKKVELTFAEIKYFFCVACASSYTSFMADAANVHTFGGLMGTYSEYDSGPLPLMNVHKGFSAHLTFYQNYLGFKLDPEGRRYGEYLPGMLCDPPVP